LDLIRAGLRFIEKGEQHDDIVLHRAHRLFEIENLRTVHLHPVVHVFLDALIISLKNFDHSMPPFCGTCYPHYHSKPPGGASIDSEAGSKTDPEEDDLDLYGKK
jgi:hypothetical protein